MSWTAPKTWVANTVLSAAEMNEQVRDNLLQTAPAKATAAGRLFVTTGLNALAERVPTTASVVASESTTSASYTDLATAGPAVTVDTGTAAIVLLTAGLSNTNSAATAYAGFAVSGATTTAASDVDAIYYQASAANAIGRQSMHTMATVTGGSNTFTAKYRTTANTASFARRVLTVVPL